MCRQLPGNFIHTNSWELEILIWQVGLRRPGVCTSASSQGLRGPRLCRLTDLCPSAGTLAICALSLAWDSENLGPSFVCGFKGLPPVKDLVFSSAGPHPVILPGLRWASGEAVDNSSLGSGGAVSKRAKQSDGYRVCPASFWSCVSHGGRLRRSKYLAKFKDSIVVVSKSP